VLFALFNNGVNIGRIKAVMVAIYQSI